MSKINEFKEVKGSLLIKSNCTSLVHDLGGRIEPKVITELERQLQILLIRGFERAKENGRSTLMRRDL